MKKSFNKILTFGAVSALVATSFVSVAGAAGMWVGIDTPIMGNDVVETSEIPAVSVSGTFSNADLISIGYYTEDTVFGPFHFTVNGRTEEADVPVFNVHDAVASINSGGSSILDISVDDGLGNTYRFHTTPPSRFTIGSVAGSPLFSITNIEVLKNSDVMLTDVRFTMRANNTWMLSSPSTGSSAILATGGWSATESYGAFSNDMVRGGAVVGVSSSWTSGPVNVSVLGRSSSVGDRFVAAIPWFVSGPGEYSNYSTFIEEKPFTIGDPTADNGGGTSVTRSHRRRSSSVKRAPQRQTVAQTVTSCIAFDTYARLGDSGEHVSKIQAFLKEKGYYAGEVMGYFDQATDTAVRAFQNAYPEEILSPWGISRSTGYWYVTTTAKANRMMNCQ